jgi:WD40 repeat protein
VSAASFGSGGSLLAVADTRGTAVLWDVTVPAEPARQKTINARTLTITADGSLLLTGSSDGLSLFRIGDEGLVADSDLPAAGDVTRIAVDARGRTAVTVSSDGSGSVWNLSEEEPPTPAASLDVPGGQLDQVIMSQDSPLLVGSSPQGMPVWGLDHPDRPTQLSEVGTEQAPSILGGFSSDGGWLLTATENEALIWAGVAWFAPGTDVLTHACAVADGGLTPRQWQEYLPGIAYRNTCVR